MAEIVYEIHVPLVAPADIPESEYDFPWINGVEDFVKELGDPQVEWFDAGLVWENNAGDPEYLFFICGPSDTALLKASVSISNLPEVPIGVYALRGDEDTVLGAGERVALRR